MQVANTSKMPNGGLMWCESIIFATSSSLKSTFPPLRASYTSCHGALHKCFRLVASSCLMDIPASDQLLPSFLTYSESPFIVVSLDFFKTSFNVSMNLHDDATNESPYILLSASNTNPPSLFSSLFMAILASGREMSRSSSRSKYAHMPPYLTCFSAVL